jgi:hypothetical protein
MSALTIVGRAERLQAPLLRGEERREIENRGRSGFA